MASLKNILVINCGSSSIKFQIIDPISKTKILNGIAERIGTPKAVIKLKREDNKKENYDIGNANHKITFDKISDLITGKYQIKAVGHRVVHGGIFFQNSVKICDEVKSRIKELFPLGVHS